MPIHVSQGVWDLIEGVTGEVHEGLLYNNVQYILALEGGHSTQAAEGEMVEDQLPIVETYMADVAVPEAIGRIARGEEAGRAFDRAVTDGTMYALRRVVMHTPVDLGIARLGWSVLLPGGRQSSAGEEGMAPPAKPASESRWASRRTRGTP